MTDSVAAPAGTDGTATRRLVLVLLAGGAVAVALGVYSKVHDPTHEQPYTLFFTEHDPAEGVVRDRRGRARRRAGPARRCASTTRSRCRARAPSWLGDAHRLVGTLAFVLTPPGRLPVPLGLGFQSTDTRVLVHSILGCFFYGIFTVKVLAVRVHGLPDSTLPVVGGLVFAVLVGVWLTSSVLVLHVPTARRCRLY